MKVELASNYKTLELIHGLIRQDRDEESIDAKLSYYSQQYAKSFRAFCLF